MKVLSSLKSAKTVLAAKLFVATVSSMSFRKPTLALKRVKVGKRKVKGNKKSDLHSKIWTPILRCRLCLTLINFV